MIASSSSPFLPLLCAFRSGAAASLVLRKGTGLLRKSCPMRLQCQFYAAPISKSFEIPKSSQRQSYEDFIQEQLKLNKSSKMPLAIFRLVTGFKAKFFKPRDNLHPELKILLDKSAAQLYYSCAENVNFTSLCKEFGIPDQFSSWFKITLLHVWMLLFRLHISLDAPSYQRFQHSILTTLWADVDKRIKIMDEFTKGKPHSTAEMKQVHGLYIQSFLEYDEGILSDDVTLAASIWRNLYLEEKFEADHVANVVRYIRATIAHLSELNANDILVTGIDQWKVAEEIKSLHSQ